MIELISFLISIRRSMDRLIALGNKHDWDHQKRIGPTNTSKISRLGIRVRDLHNFEYFDTRFRALVDQAMAAHFGILSFYFR